MQKLFVVAVGLVLGCGSDPLRLSGTKTDAGAALETKDATVGIVLDARLIPDLLIATDSTAEKTDAEARADITPDVLVAAPDVVTLADRLADKSETQVVVDLPPLPIDVPADSRDAADARRDAIPDTIVFPDVVVVKDVGKAETTVTPDVTPDALLAKLDTQIVTDLAPPTVDVFVGHDLQSDTLVALDTTPAIDTTPPTKTPVIKVSPSNGYPSEEIVIADTSDNAVLATTFNPADPNRTYYPTRLTVQLGNVDAAKIIRAVRLSDAADKTVCSGSLSPSGQLKCTDDRGLFPIKGATTIVTRVDLNPIDAPLGTKSGTIVRLMLFVDNAAQHDDFGALEMFDDLGNLFHGTDFFTDANEATSKIYQGGWPAVVYKTQPLVFLLAPPNTTSLVDGEQTTFAFHESADAMGELGQKRFVISVMAYDLQSVQSARLIMNGSQYDRASIVSGGLDLKTGKLSFAPDPATGSKSYSFTITVTADNQFTTAAGQDSTFALKLTVSGTQTGSQISSWLGNDPLSPDIGTVASHEASTFVWSDESDPNHSGSSTDWIGGRLVLGLQTATYTIWR